MLFRSADVAYEGSFVKILYLDVKGKQAGMCNIELVSPANIEYAAASLKISFTITPSKSQLQAKAEAEAKAKAEAEAKAKAEAEAKAKAEATKEKTITCIKGKLTKKIKGTNPKCPTGYKKK